MILTEDQRARFEYAIAKKVLAEKTFIVENVNVNTIAKEFLGEDGNWNYNENGELVIVKEEQKPEESK